MDKINYEATYKYYLFQDNYSREYGNKYICLDDMTIHIPELFAYMYLEIIEYDEKDRIRRQVGNSYEKIKNEALIKSYNSYTNAVKDISSWTCFKVESIDNDVIRIYV